MVAVVRIKLSILFTLVVSFFVSPADPLAAQRLNRLLWVGDSLKIQNEYDSAVVIMIEALKLAQWQYGRMDTTVAFVHEKLADYYYHRIPGYVDTTRLAIELTARWRQSLSQAEEHCLSAIDIWSALGGSNNLHLNRLLDLLGKIYEGEGKTAQADSARSRAQFIKRLFFGRYDPRSALDLVEYAQVLQASGEYVAAEEVFDSTMAILERSYGQNNRRTIIVNFLNKSDPVAYYTAHQDSLEQVLAEQELADSLYLSSLTNLSQNRLDDAERDCTRSLNIYRRSLGTKCLDVAGSFRQLGRIYWRKGLNLKADSALRKASVILGEILGPESLDLSDNLVTNAAVLVSERNFQAADSLFQRAFLIDSSNPAARDDKLALILDGLGKCNRYQNRPDSALQLFARAALLRLALFENGVSTIPERDALLLSNQLRESLSLILSAYQDLREGESMLTGQVADIVFSTKGIVSEVMAARHNALQSSKNGPVQALVDSLRHTRYYLSQLFVSRLQYEDPMLFGQRIDSINLAINCLEAELAHHSADIRGYRSDLFVQHSEVAASLSDGWGLVEFVQYDYRSIDSDLARSHYVAVTIKSGGEPSLIDLGDASAIDTLISQYRTTMAQASGGTVASTSELDKKYRQISSLLSRTVWMPVLEGLHGAKGLIIATDGGLNFVSFAALPDKNRNYTIETYDVKYILSGRELTRRRDGNPIGSGLLAMGDPDYDATPEHRLARRIVDPRPPEPTQGNLRTTRNVRPGCEALDSLSVMPLPGTRQEVKRVAESWSTARKEPAEVFLGAEASEENFKSAATGKQVIHLATHGYFLEEPCKVETPLPDDALKIDYTLENPMLLSGILLAGSNNHGDAADSARVEDGILTAEEVASMDFTGTSLVVLSTCESGLGLIHEGEGVYGLRRAFLQAGARGVMSSLWPVSDQSTCDMMKYIYSDPNSEWSERLRNYALKQIADARNTGASSHPWTWAPFVITGR